MPTLTDHEIDAGFGEYLRRNRMAHGMDVDQAAKALDFTRDRLVALEHGVGAGVSNRELAAICRVFRLDHEMARKRAAGIALPVRGVA